MRDIFLKKSWHVVRGDTVFVRTGRSAGHIGRVIDVLRTRNRLVVEGANLVKRHIRAEEINQVVLFLLLVLFTILI
jgi:large subunit ribosomal protein L24